MSISREAERSLKKLQNHNQLEIRTIKKSARKPARFADLRTENFYFGIIVKTKYDLLGQVILFFLYRRENVGLLRREITL